MRGVTSEFIAAILAVFIPAVAIAERPLEVPMVAIYPLAGRADPTLLSHMKNTLVILVVGLTPSLVIVA